MFRRAAAPVFLLCLCAAVSLNAQQRDGFWLAFAPGAGWTLDRAPGGGRGIGQWTGGYIRLGGTISERLRLGLELAGVSNGTLSRGNTSAMAQWFPLRGVDEVFVKAGLGPAFLERRLEVGPSTDLVTSHVAFGLTLGAGWETSLGRVRFSPSIDFLLQTRKTVEASGGYYGILLWSVGVAFP